MANNPFPLGLENRKDILEISLIIEGLSSHFIAGILDIQNVEESRTLGNKSSALSFNQKVDLLIDLGALEPEVRSKFQAFMEIRNQFMHNMEATSYEKLFTYLPAGKENFLLKSYPQSKELPREQILKNVSLELGKEVLNVTGKLIENVKQRLADKAAHDITRQSNDAFQKAISSVGSHINEAVLRIAEDREVVKVSELKNLGTEVSKWIYMLWKKNFDEIIKTDRESGQKK